MPKSRNGNCPLLSLYAPSQDKKIFTRYGNRKNTGMLAKMIMINISALDVNLRIINTGLG